MPLRTILIRAAKKIGATGAASIALIALGLWHREGVAWLGEGWDLVKVVLVFAFMVTLLRHKVDVGLVLMLSAVLLGGLFSLPAGRIARVMVFDAFGDEPTLHHLLFKAVVLMVVILLINALGRLMEAAGTLWRLIESLDDLVRDGRYVMAMIPAAMGLLPMPGGAMLSAPFVGELGDRLGISPEDKTLVNYWFRHIFEYAWPLYPAVIMAADFTKRPLSSIMLTHAPMIFAAAGIGLVMLHAHFPHKRLAMGKRGRLSSNLLTLAEAVWPVVVVAATVGVSPYVATGRAKALLFPASLLFVNVVVALASGLTRVQLAKVLRKSFSWQMIVLVLSIYMLRGMFEQTNVTANMPSLLSGLGIPCTVILFFVPFMVGLLTGYNVAAVSTGFPALLALMPSGADVLIAYCGAFMGVLSSPVHLCLVLTRDYFKANLGQVYRRLLPMLAALLGVLAAYAFALKHFGLAR